LTVRRRAETVATLRHIEITAMETLSRWVPTTPMMEIKVLFGRHIWETAQHADILGKRTHELRAPLNLTLEPTPEYAGFLADLAAIQPQAERLSAFYDVFLPAISARCRAFIEATDALLDEPTVRILERIIRDNQSMIDESLRLRSEYPQISLVDAAWREQLAARERDIAEFVAGWQQRPAAEASNA